MKIGSSIAGVMIFLLGFCPSPGFAQSWPVVPPVDLSKLSPADFADDELDLPYYLQHFHRVANSVVESGPDKGFINISVWRNLVDNKPHNARIMENILSLAYFYSTKRPWNPYYNMPALRSRLEAAIDFLHRIQDTSGAYSEYGPKKWNLAASAFATKFMGGTLVLLKQGPAISPGALQKLKEADRKAIYFVLNDPEMYTTGIRYSNQFTNVWAGAFAYLSLYPDAAMKKRLEERMKQSLTDFQSPAGYFYEANGIDFSYNFHTHHSNLWMSYHYSRGTAAGKIITDAENAFANWISYNATPEPGTHTYTINKSIEMRQRASVVQSYFVESPLGETSPGVRAYNFTADEVKSDRLAQRKALEKDWPRVPALQTGTFGAYTPYTFLHRKHYTWYPTKKQRQAAADMLPFNRSSRFVHQKKDNNFPIVFTYVRRPGYYAIFNSGAILNDRQRFGLGLLWSPAGGTFLQSQSSSDSLAWGTMPAGGRLYESDTLDAGFLVNNKTVLAQVGNRDLETGALAVSYPLGKDGNKSIEFADGVIRVRIKHAGAFTENFPLLLGASDSLKLEKNMLVLYKKGTLVRFIFPATATATLKKTGVSSGEQQLTMLYLRAQDSLDYSILAGDEKSNVGN